MGKKKQKIPTIDPLYQLFEHYLFNRSYEDTETFTKEIAEEYLAYLDSTPAHVPFHTRLSVLKDLESEAHEMLVKKMYGVVSSREYTNIGQVMRATSKTESESFDIIPAQIPERPSKKD